MKKILLNLLTACFCLYGAAQSIHTDDPVVVKYPTGDSTITVRFFIESDSAFKVNITDLFKGSASPVRDYEFTPVHLTNVIHTGSFSVELRPGTQKHNKVIRLKISAKSDDTTIYSEIKILECLDTTKLSYRLPDETNTPKFEFVSYTDFKGFEQDEPNGIAQSQFLFKLPINRYYTQTGTGNYRVQWFRSLIFPDFIFNRIDKTDKAPALQPTYSKYGDSVVVSPVINTFDFVKYSNFILNSKLAVVSVFRPKSRIQLQLSGSLYKIKVDSATIVKSSLGIDSLVKNDTAKAGLNPVWATGFGAEIYYDTHYTPDEFPFNFRFIFGWSIIKNRSSEYKQADVGYTSPDRTTSSAIFIGHNKKFSSPIWSLSAMITKNLDLKKKEVNASDDHYIFFRFNYSWQSFKGNVLTSQRPVTYTPTRLTNNFSQFQLGLDLNFDGFFK